MPLAGIITPSGNELTWDEALAYAQKHGVCGDFPYAILKAIKDDTDEEHDLISASQIVGCLRQAWLKSTEDYFEKAGGRLAMLIGSLCHKRFSECAEPGSLTEVKLKWTTPNGIIVTGHCDVITSRGEIVDWKTARKVNIANLPYGNHEAQLNVYRFLLAHNELEPQMEAQGLIIYYIDLKGPDERQGHGGVVRFSVDAWPDVRVEDYIITRASILQNAESVLPPLADDRWTCTYCPAEVFRICKEAQAHGR